MRRNGRKRLALPAVVVSFCLTFAAGKAGAGVLHPEDQDDVRPWGLHVGLGLGRATALAGSGTNSTEWAWAASLEADYQAGSFYFGAVGMEVYGDHLDAFLTTDLETRVLALRGGGLWRVGPIDLFAGGGGGYVWQQFATNLGVEDGGTASQVGPVDTVRCVGALAEVGAIVLRGERHFQLSVVARVFVPFSKHSDPKVDQRFPVAIFMLRTQF